MFDKKCETCQNNIDFSKLGKYAKRSGRFCSSVCAKKYSSKQLKLNPKTKIRSCDICNNSIVVDVRAYKGICLECKNKKLSLKYNTVTNICYICNSNFQHPENINRKFCSTNCRHEWTKSPEYSKIMSQKMKGRTGGYTEGTGNSKSGYYKGIYSASTYELIWIIYRLDNNLFVKRFEGYLKDEVTGLTYYPDFISEDNSTIYEIKGYWTDKVDLKSELARKNGFNIDVLYKQDLTKEFEWVKNKYRYIKVEQLYDNYKPKFEYICCSCKTNFTSEKKRKTKTYFCSRKCTFKFNRNFKYNILKNS